MSQSFLLELRTAATRCSNVPYKEVLRNAADEVARAAGRLSKTMDTEHMRTLVGAWTVAAVILKNLPPEAEPNAPLAGAPEAARLAA